jgi:hypothetical protein
VNNGGRSRTVSISRGIYMPNWTAASGATLSWQDPTYYAVGMGLFEAPDRGRSKGWIPEPSIKKRSCSPVRHSNGYMHLPNQYGIVMLQVWGAQS